METSTALDNVRKTLLRSIVVGCVTVGFGLLFFRLSVFDTRMVAFQFLVSGVTAAVFYPFLKSGRRWEGLVPLAVWFLLLTFFIGQYTPFLPVNNFLYVTGIAAAVGVYESLVRRELLRGLLQRVASAGVIIAIANAVIYALLSLRFWPAVSTSFGYYASMAFRNLQFGTLIGIGFGLGVEAAEYLVPRMGGQTGTAVPGAPGPGGLHHVSTLMHGETIVVTCASCGTELELTPGQIAAETYTCTSCGKPGAL
jgi:hypothetical protein